MFKTILWVIGIFLLWQHFMNKNVPYVDPEPEQQMTQAELEDAKEFAQNLIQVNNQCKKVTSFTPANMFHKEIIVWCDDYYEYYITKPNGKWKVELQ